MIKTQMSEACPTEWRPFDSNGPAVNVRPVYRRISNSMKKKEALDCIEALNSLLIVFCFENLTGQHQGIQVVFVFIVLPAF
jgi:hypothetical protein